jgi:hypothetical protein
MTLKASEALALVAGLVAAYGLEAVDRELSAIETPPLPKSPDAREIDVKDAIGKLEGASEFRAILDALPKPTAAAAPAAPRHRRSEAEVNELCSQVMTRVNELGSEVSAAEVASQLGVETRAVSHALQCLVHDGKVAKSGDRRTTRYAAVKAA